MSHVIVVGAGIFGATTALALRMRGHEVSLLDPGPIPHPLAASTDISKVVRMEYGPDELYMELVERAHAGWLRWNQEWARDGDPPLYHETGVLMLTRDEMASGGFEHESHRLLLRRGHAPERMSSTLIAERFPAWRADRYVDGFFHARGGYAESGRVVEAIVRWGERQGVALYSSREMSELLHEGDRVVGIRDADGNSLRADGVVVAAGAWTGKLLGALSASIQATGHPVYHLEPQEATLFRAGVFPVFTADIARTGYYGFPLNADGVVKIGNHGVGRSLDPDAPRELGEADLAGLRAFLAETFPALLNAKVVYTRVCLYADTQDQDLWIAADPGRPGLVVAGGGSGHGFKFAPILGDLVADAVEGRENPTLHRFVWRPELRLGRGKEAARYHGREDEQDDHERRTT